MSFPPSRVPLDRGPFAPPALPGFLATAGLSATLPAQAGPRGFPVGACAPPTGLPVLLLSPSYVHATVNTPAETTGARVARFPVAGSLPRNTGGSASALIVSRPAQRSLHVVACTLAEPPSAVLFHRSASVRFVTSSNRSDCLPAGATVAGRGLHPQGNGAFPRRTVSHEFTGNYTSRTLQDNISIARPLRSRPSCTSTCI